MSPTLRLPSQAGLVNGPWMDLVGILMHAMLKRCPLRLHERSAQSVLQAGVAPHVVPAAAPSITDAVAAKFAAANASFMQGQPGVLPPATPPTPAPASAAATAATPPADAAKLAALDAILAQFQQAVPAASGNNRALLTAFSGVR